MYLQTSLTWIEEPWIVVNKKKKQLCKSILLLRIGWHNELF